MIGLREVWSVDFLIDRYSSTHNIQSTLQYHFIDFVCSTYIFANIVTFSNKDSSMSTRELLYSFLVRQKAITDHLRIKSISLIPYKSNTLCPFLNASPDKEVSWFQDRSLEETMYIASN